MNDEDDNVSPNKPQTILLLHEILTPVDYKIFDDTFFSCINCNRFSTSNFLEYKEHKLSTCNISKCKNINKDILENIKEIKNLLGKPKDIVVTTTEPIKKEHVNYKPLNSKKIELREEPDEEEMNKQIKEITIMIESKRKNFKNMDEVHSVFKNCFDMIQNNRTYTKTLDLIKKTRLEVLESIPLPDYINLLMEHISTLTHIFESKGVYKDKKIAQNVLKCLTTIDTRLIFYDSYTNVELNMDELSPFRCCLDITNNFPKEYTPFVNDTFFKMFHNYGSVIFTIKENIEKFLFSPYGLFNVIYLENPKSSDSDPFSYYVLNRIEKHAQKKEKDKRFWNLDCRLEELTNNFISDLRPNLIQIFRKIYYDVFHDNEYRPTYSSETPITASDCEQLIQNIFTLSNPLECCNLFRKVVKERATYKATKNDNFNINSDDTMQKKRFAQKKENNADEVVETVRLLFDKITYEEAVDLYRAKHISHSL